MTDLQKGGIAGWFFAVVCTAAIAIWVPEGTVWDAGIAMCFVGVIAYGAMLLGWRP